MARLPIPGSDNGNWGTILNDYLSQVHKADGSLKDNVVTNAMIADGSISEVLLDNSIQTKLNTPIPDATSLTKGKVQLAGDLGGTATVPTVPGLANKAGAVMPTTIKTAAYTATAMDLIPADATSGGFTITLPAAPVDRSIILVKKIDATANTVTVARGGSDTFNVEGGATSMQLTLQDQTVTLQYKASGGIWYVTGHGAAVAAFDARYTPLHPLRVYDYYGNTAIRVLETTYSTVNNWFQVEHNQNTDDRVNLAVEGESTNLDLYLKPKGTGVVRVYTPSGVTPTIRAAGVDIDAGLNLRSKGTGTVQANGVQITDISSAQTLTNKTLTSPRIITSVLDTNGNTLLGITATASAVNYPQIVNAATGGVVYLRALGSDSSIPLGLRPKGVEGVYIYDSNAAKVAVFLIGSGTPVNNWKFQSSSTGNAITATAEGTDTDISINFVPKGTGKVRAGGNEIITYVTPPASASATGTAGQQAYDSNYHYICTATNTWMRHAITTW